MTWRVNDVVIVTEKALTHTKETQYLSPTGGGPGFEPPSGTGDLSGCSLHGPVELVEMRVSWSGHPRISKKKKKNSIFGGR